MADEIQLEVVTPERRFLSLKVVSVTAPGITGEFGVLNAHAPFMTPLGTGILSYKSTDGAGSLVVSRGFAEVADNKVTVLAEHADLATEIDLQQAQADVKALEERLKGKGEVDTEFTRLRAELERATAKVSLASKR